MADTSSNFITFNVVSTGAMVEGFDTAAVRANLEQKLRLPPPQAAAFFEKRRVLKKGLKQADAENLSGQLAKLGIETTVEKIEPRLNRPEVGLSLEPRDDEDESPTPQAEPTTDQPMRCPRCDHEQPRSEQCASCGVWFHKLAQIEDTSPEAAESNGSSLAGPGSGAGLGLSPGAAADLDEDSIEEEHLSAKSVAAAAGAALLGALLWKIIATSFGYEVGLIAWGIGGAVGFAAASTGSRGLTAGIVCGALAFGAIGLGKYWSTQAAIEEVQQGIAEILGDSTESGGWYQEFAEDARILREVSDSDASIRRYMVDRGYTEAVSANDVTSEELTEFREIYEADLRSFDPEQTDEEGWEAITLGEIAQVSTMEVVLDGLGAIDLLFLVLGVGTAFRLGRSME